MMCYGGELADLRKANMGSQNNALRQQNQMRSTKKGDFPYPIISPWCVLTPIEIILGNILWPF